MDVAIKAFITDLSKQINANEVYPEIDLTRLYKNILLFMIILL